MKNIVKALFAALAIAVLSGCATPIPGPKIFSEQKGAVPPQPVKKVLVVVDMSLEFDQLPSGLAFSKDDNAKRMYEPVAKAMADEVRMSGGEADYVLHTTKATLNIPAEYSHVWLQKLDRFTKTSYNGGAGGYYISGRIWKATIGQRQMTTPERFDSIFISEYEADNPWCFMPPLITDKEGCQKRYMDNIVQQWRKSGLN
jgi:hypothetical protein